MKRKPAIKTVSNVGVKKNQLVMTTQLISICQWGDATLLQEFLMHSESNAKTCLDATSVSWVLACVLTCVCMYVQTKQDCKYASGLPRTTLVVVPVWTVSLGPGTQLVDQAGGPGSLPQCWRSQGHVTMLAVLHGLWGSNLGLQAYVKHSIVWIISSASDFFFLIF